MVLASSSFSLEILKDWIGLIDDDGWVAREQILGEEARSKVHKFLYMCVPCLHLLQGPSRVPNPST
jgi:hypothetical protein